MIAAAAGKFGIDLLIGAALQMMRDDSHRMLRGWGLAYCYGNRLEAVEAVRARLRLSDEYRDKHPQE